MKLNSIKCHLLVCGHKFECIISQVGNTQVIEENMIKLLGVEIDFGLTFERHMQAICQKVSRKLNALSRSCSLLPFHKRKLLMNAFFNSQFSHCPLLWKFYNRGINTKNNLHYRIMRLVY